MIAALVLVLILGATAAMQTRSIMRQARLLTAERGGIGELSTAVDEIKGALDTPPAPNPRCEFTAELRNAVPLFQCRVRDSVATLETRAGKNKLGANVIIRRFFAPVQIPTWSEIAQACAKDCITGAVRDVDSERESVRVPTDTRTLFSRQAIRINTLEIELPRTSDLTILSPFDVVIGNILLDGPADSPRVRLAAYSGSGHARLPEALGCERIEWVEIERYGWRSGCGILRGKASRTRMSGVYFEPRSPHDPK